MNRPRYTPDTITRFMALAHQGTGPHAAPEAPHPASNLRTTLALLDDDEKGVHSVDTLPTTTPEDHA